PPRRRHCSKPSSLMTSELDPTWRATLRSVPACLLRNQRSQRCRQVVGAGWTAGSSGPDVVLDALQDALRDGEGSTAVVARDAWRRSRPHGADEVGQLAGELILGLAVSCHGLQVAAEEVFANAGAGGRIETGRVQTALAQLHGGLHERQLAL